MFIEEGGTVTRMASLYLHIPFCERKCIYCDFYSIENRSHTEDFLAALQQEIDRYALMGKGTEFETIFFGGGTPSLLTPPQLESVMNRLYSAFSITADAEITVETNPGTVTPEKFRAYRSLGVNRVSIGIQSFHEDELQFLGRIHDSMQAVRCVEHARAAGFDNVSIDLIYSLPGQTGERWAATLHRAVELKPEHISAYSLIVEDNTPLARMVRSKSVSPNPSDAEAALYEMTMEFMMERGFEHYEVSNYARPGFRSRHNYNYWNHKNYLGFGPSAHSFWKKPGDAHGRRWWNIANLSTYSDRIREGKLPVASEEHVQTSELLTERIFLGLRSDGVNLKRLLMDFGIDLPATRGALLEQLLTEEYVTIENESLRLTSKGYLLCDEVSGRLIP